MQDNIEIFLANQIKQLEADKGRLDKTLKNEKFRRKKEQSYDEIRSRCFENPSCNIMMAFSKSTNDEPLDKDPTHNHMNSEISKLAENNVNPFLFFDDVVKTRLLDNKRIKATNDGVSSMNAADKNFKNITNGTGTPNRISYKVDANENEISDDFYSYFPSFKNLKTKQIQNQNSKKDYQEYLEKKMDFNEKIKKQNESNFIGMKTTEDDTNDNYNLIGRNKQQHQQNVPLKINKTEIEIIVNNPNINSKHNITTPTSSLSQTQTTLSSTQKSSPRDKLLEDLRHTAISNMVHTNAIQERNRQIAEKKIQKQQEYQKQLMQQIEEKRQEIKVLKEKERREEELSARKLDQQLKAIQLENNLEKVKVRYEKIRQENKQNDIENEKLNKFETIINNTKPLENYHNSNCMINKRQIKSENNKENQRSHNHHCINPVNNKVYKYFSNSPRLDITSTRYHQNYDVYEDKRNRQFIDDSLRSKSETVPTSFLSINTDFFGNNLKTTTHNINYNDNEIDDISNNNNNNHNIGNEIVPTNYNKSFIHKNSCIFCHKKLKNYNEQENCCFHCGTMISGNKNSITELSSPSQSSSLLYFNSNENDYFCFDCNKKLICNYCYRKRILCSNCVCNFCINCGKKIQNCLTAMSTPSSFITKFNQDNDYCYHQQQFVQNDKKERKNTEKSFKILEINCPESYKDEIQSKEHNNEISKIENEYIPHKFLLNDNNLEEIKMKTNSKLTKYFNNYGDLAVANTSNGSSRSKLTKSTQTSVENTPKMKQTLTTGSNIEEELSMPLLKESLSNQQILKQKSTFSTGGEHSEDDDDEKDVTIKSLNSDAMILLSQRWEIPEVQKRKYSNDTKLITQTGAFKKQLQMEKLDFN